MINQILPDNEQQGILYDNVLGESINDELKGRKFILCEYFCDNIQCDCKSVVVAVEEINDLEAAKSQPPVASIRYDWSDTQPEIILDEEHDQSLLAPAMLEMYKTLVQKKEYTARLVLKYKLFKAWCKINSLLAEVDSKIGRNEPCICGSGKKYKKCCLKR